MYSRREDRIIYYSKDDSSPSPYWNDVSSEILTKGYIIEYEKKEPLARGSAIAANWPDALNCSGGIAYLMVFESKPRYQLFNGPQTFRLVFDQSSRKQTASDFTQSGSNNWSSWNTSCRGKSIDELVSEGKALYFGE